MTWLFKISQKLPEFSTDELDRLSEICADIGQVFFASMVVPFFFGLDKVNLSVLSLGLITSLGFWFASIRLVKIKVLLQKGE